MDGKEMKQILKQAAQSACNFLKALLKGAKDAAVALHNDYSNAQKIKMNQIQQNNNLAIMQQIQWELFSVFQGRKYPYLKIVEVVGDIIPFNITQYGILFENPSQPLPSFALPQVKELMNGDINSFRQWIIANRLQASYPCIMHGMYIADIKANGIYAVLTVGFPQ